MFYKHVPTVWQWVTDTEKEDCRGSWPKSIAPRQWLELLVICLNENKATDIHTVVYSALVWCHTGHWCCVNTTDDVVCTGKSLGGTVGTQGVFGEGIRELGWWETWAASVALSLLVFGLNLGWPSATWVSILFPQGWVKWDSVNGMGVGNVYRGSVDSGVMNVLIVK